MDEDREMMLRVENQACAKIDLSKANPFRRLRVRKFR